MKIADRQFAHNLLNVEDEQLQKLNQIVCEAVKQEELLLATISNKTSETLTAGQRISDKVARFGGSWKFIILFGVVLAVWIIINSFLPEKQRFDAYPFILMNLILSCIAALQAPIIMMSQNRQEEKDRERGESDYMINLKSEIEIRTLHQKMDLLLQEQFKKLVETQAEQIRLLHTIIDKEARKPKQ
jgi:uncharacterized membrane protein